MFLRIVSGYYHQRNTGNASVGSGVKSTRKLYSSKSFVTDKKTA